MINPYLAGAGLAVGLALFVRPSKAVQAIVYGDGPDSQGDTPPVSYPTGSQVDPEQIELLEWRIRDATSNLAAIAGELARPKLSAEQTGALLAEQEKEQARLALNQEALANLQG